MTRLIDADALLEELKKYQYYRCINNLITNAPTIESSEVSSQAVAIVDDLERGGRVRALALGLGLDTKLYTAPPQQQWVGLTSEQITNIGMQHQSLHQVAKAIDNELRKLNNV